MILIAFGAAFITLNLWMMARRDNARGRQLRSYRVFADDRFVFLSLPGLTLLLFGFGFMGMARTAAGTSLGMALAVAAGLATVFGFVFSLWGVFGKNVPRFAQPRWIRSEPPTSNKSRPRKKPGKKSPKKK